MFDKFSYTFTNSQIHGFLKRNKLKTGITGQFKKGNTPYNKVPIGSEKKRDGYIEVKVAEPSEWKLKHHLIWEKHYGSIPKGKRVIFGDKDKTNFNIDNLILVNNKQQFYLNKNHLAKENKELTQVGLNVANVLIKIDEIKNNDNK